MGEIKNKGVIKLLVRLYSFDIFDTVAARCCSTPEGFFLLMQESLKGEAFADIPEHVRSNFASLRILAQKSAFEFYTTEDRQEITLSDIYDSLCGDILSPEMKKRLYRLEIETEIRVQLPLMDNIEYIKSLISDGKRVVFISDMYLALEDVKELLHALCPDFDEIPVYVSSEYEKRKENGELFRIVKSKENVEFCEWEHTGDNPAGDIRVPRELGIAVKQVYKKVSPGEEYVLNANTHNIATQLMVGASGYLRRQHSLDEFAEIGVTVGAGILFPYTLWVVNEAVKRNIKHLYFVARDGYVLMRMAQCIVGELGYDIKLSYLYGSREAWRGPSVNLETDFSKLDWIFRTYDSPNMKIFLEHFGLDETFLTQLPEEFQNINLEFTDGSIEKLRDCFASDKELVKAIVDRNTEKRELIKKYCAQEIDFSEEYALVELRGTGASIDCLCSIIGELSPKKIRAFYYEVHIEHGLHAMHEKLIFMNASGFDFSLLETFTRAIHGMTLCYEDKGEKVVPVLEEQEGLQLKRYGYDKYIEGLCHFSHEYLGILKKVYGTASGSLPTVDIEPSVAYLRYLTEEPDKALASFIGNQPFLRAGTHMEDQKFSPPLTYDTVMRYCYGKLPVENHSMKISYAITESEFLRFLVDFEKHHRRISRVIRGIYYLRVLGFEETARRLRKII